MRGTISARDSVAVGTMHLAKGLEFRAVVVAACDDELALFDLLLADSITKADRE